MENSEIAITVRGLGKQYRRGELVKSTNTIEDWFVNRCSQIRNIATGKQSIKSIHSDTFWALKDVSFDIMKGDVVGIIGRNGAGKSTLLKILSRITAPTTGRVEINGSIDSLLEVGTGFHQEMTGRENIYMNAALHGLTRNEINARMEDIIKFSGVEEFLDTPVKHYSSGMGVRLGFAVAAHMDPDILVVDEVLAVGDAEFQKKCLGKMKEVSEGGKTVLFVSHNMPMISSLCSKGLLLNNGNLIKTGEMNSIVQEYYNSFFSRSSSALANNIYQKNIKAKFCGARILNQKGDPIHECRIDEPFCLEMEYELLVENLVVYANIHVKDSHGSYVFVTMDSYVDRDSQLKTHKGKYLSRCNIPANLMNAETYYFGFALVSTKNLEVHFF